MDNYLKKKIISLIESKYEGEYWDFKEKYYTNKANMVHDIICMANNRADKDAYIILGIEDKEFKIVGIENDINRKNQQQIIDVLKSKKFSGGIRPVIEMKTLKFDGHEIDIIIIKNTNDTPYYLIEDYKEQNRTVRAQYIYTRVGDTNTDIDKGADINHVEYLWKKRFLLNKPPLEQIKNRLKNKEEWVEKEYTYYNMFNPEYRIEKEYDDEDLHPEFYSYAMYNQSTTYGILKIKCYETELEAFQFVVLDGGRYVTTVPDWEFIRFGEYKPDFDYCFKYFIKDNIKYKLHEFLLEDDNSEAVFACKRFREVILIFENRNEKDRFVNYIHINECKFKKLIEEHNCRYEWLECENDLVKKENIKRLKTGEVLNKMLVDFREENKL